MFGSATLEVAIGLVFLFFILSLIMSAAREMLEARLQSRAIHLERGIRELLDDETGEELASAIYGHPLVASLYTGDYKPGTQHGINYTDPEARAGRSGKKDPWHRMKFGSNLPAYIPARNFALALLDLSARGDAKRDEVDEAAIDTDRIRAGLVKNIPSARVQRAVLIALDQAEGDLEKARANIEAWYDSGMDRVSGWYRKNTQWILFAMGLVVAVTLNVDTIRVTRDLYENDGMREVVVAEATAAVDSARAREDGPLDAQAQLELLGCPSEAAQKQISCAQGKLENLGLPIGWSDQTVVWPWQVNRDLDGLLGWVGSFPWSSLPGWLLTALALALGAPFWFDVLNKFIVIRSTVKPHEKSPEEASEDRQSPASRAESPARTAESPQGKPAPG